MEGRVKVEFLFRQSTELRKNAEETASALVIKRAGLGRNEKFHFEIFIEDGSSINPIHIRKSTTRK